MSNNNSDFAEDIDQSYREYQEQDRIWGVIEKSRIKKIKFPRIEQRFIDEFLALEDDVTGSVSDILDSLGYRKTVPASYLSPILPGKLMVGTAITLRSIVIEKTVTQGINDQDFIKMASRDVNYLAEPGDVLVADCGGMLDMSSMGGQSVVSAKVRGLAGAVVDGAVRDVGTWKRYDFPCWCKGRTPMTGKCRIEAIEVNGPVTVHNIQVMPGDLIIADDSGVCAIPPEHVEFVLEKIKQILPDEELMRELIEQNKPIKEIKKLFRKRYE